MEKLDKVVAGLECCIACDCGNCDYILEKCESRLLNDALDLLKEYRKCLTGCGIRQYGMEGLNGND